MKSEISTFEEYARITPKDYPQWEGIAQGHRACQGCGEIQAMRLVLKAAGENVIVASATGCMEIVTTAYPQTAWLVPWMHVAFENAAAVASGIQVGVEMLWSKLGKTGEKPKVMAMAGDGGTADIGMQALSGALERGHDFVYVCLDNEAYMNTGVQRSSATPFGAMTTTSPVGSVTQGQCTEKKNMAAIAAAHEIPYVATASPAFPLDLMNKVRKALTIKGPAYLHVYSPCPTGWGSKPEHSVELARLAVKTGVFPIYEITEGKLKMNHKPRKLQPIKNYVRGQKRFRHLTEERLSCIQENIRREYARLLAAEKCADIYENILATMER